MGILPSRLKGACTLAVLALALSCVIGTAATASAGRHHLAACDVKQAGTARCQALVVTPEAVSATPIGLSPATIKSVYSFSSASTAGAGRTIAIVSAFDAPKIASDLAAFNQRFGLPPCTAANGCFKKVNGTGGKNFPGVRPGWALETSMDVEWAHAIAPGAKILLVEASSNTMSALFTAVDYAKKHAQYVSMSWGTDEYAGETSLDRHFDAPGVSFFAAAGDDGVPAIYPATSPKVTSVGGTYVQMGTKGFIAEYGWSGGGGGCSKFEAASSAQASFSAYPASCAGKRAAPDVSLDASTASGVPVYDSTVFQKVSGWFTMGGTSLSTPMTAGHAATTGVPLDQTTIYGSGLHLRDITLGDNGALCAPGYELCTGRGSWLG